MNLSPALSQWYFEQRFGKSQLLLPHCIGQHLSVRVVSVRLVAQFKQLPNCHAQRPARHTHMLFSNKQQHLPDGHKSLTKFQAMLVVP